MRLEPLHGARSDPERERARLHDGPHAGVVEGEVRGAEGEGEVAAGARCERDPAEPAQLLHRPCHRADLIADVELDDLVPGPLAGVAHVDRRTHAPVT